VDQIGYQDDIPDGAAEAGLRHFFVPARSLRAQWVLPLVMLVTSLTLLGWGVAVLRAAGGFSPIFGVFTTVTVIGAAAISYVNTDPVTDLFENLDLRISALDEDITAKSDVVGEYEARRTAAEAAGEEAEKRAEANYALTIAITLGKLPPHLAGNAGSIAQVPFTHDEFVKGDWKRLPAAGAASSDSESPAAAAAPAKLAPLPGPEGPQRATGTARGQ
jgi:hypothetical protein